MDLVELADASRLVVGLRDVLDRFEVRRALLQGDQPPVPMPIPIPAEGITVLALCTCCLSLDLTDAIADELIGGESWLRSPFYYLANR